MTPDSLTMMFLLKVREGLSDRVLALLFNYEGPNPVNKTLRQFRNYIYQNDIWLQRQRHLSDDKYDKILS